MARTVLSVTKAVRGGVASPTEANGDSTNGHVVTNTGKTIITVRNADTNPHSVTFITPGTVDGQAVGDRVVSIPASSSRDFGGLPTSVYGSQMQIDVDSSQLKLVAREP
jgi:hypothetical protein